MRLYSVLICRANFADTLEGALRALRVAGDDVHSLDVAGASPVHWAAGGLMCVCRCHGVVDLVCHHEQAKGMCIQRWAHCCPRCSKAAISCVCMRTQAVDNYVGLCDRFGRAAFLKRLVEMGSSVSGAALSGWRHSLGQSLKALVQCCTSNAACL
eukprot:3987359-Amphidinium_carterae.3